MADVFPLSCDSKKGHDIFSVSDEAYRQTLVCRRCGQSVPLDIAVARTPAPMTFTFKATGASSSITAGSQT